MKLNPFTKEDWYGWAGCESAQPLIAYGQVEDYDSVWIVDDNMVCLHIDHGKEQCAVFSVTLPNRLLAAQMVGNTPDRISFDSVFKYNMERVI